MTTLAINGLGRIGRAVLRTAMDEPGLSVSAVNDLAPPDQLAYLLRHDSVFGEAEESVEADGAALQWGDARVQCFREPDPARLPWRELGVDIVVEATGAMRTRAEAARHLEAGARRVIITAPSKDADWTVCVGINHGDYDAARHEIISNASCTTNCLAPLLRVLDDAFGIETGALTTVHAVTGGQALVDQPNRKLTRGRSALVNIVPTSTGAADAIALVLPHLAGRIGGMAMRVPVVDGSVVDLVARTEAPLDAMAVNECFREAADDGPLKGILGVSEDPLVSSDVIGNDCSALVDLPSTQIIGDRTVKVLAWYDNEWGYARRVLDLTRLVSEAP